MPLEMSEEEFLNLGITFDEESKAQINAAIDEVENKLQEFVDQVGSLQDMVDQLGGVDESWLKVSDDIDKSKQSLLDFTDQQQISIDKAEQLQSIIEASNRSQIGYGNLGGEIGPAEAPEGTDVGSATSLGRGLSTAGRLAHIPQLSEAGGLVRLEESFRRVVPFFGQLNLALEASGSLIPPLTAGS